MIKEWLIRKLGGITISDSIRNPAGLAPAGQVRLTDDFGVMFQGSREGLIRYLGCIPLPKSANVTQNVTEIPSLCNNCDATAAECQTATKIRDYQNRTAQCTAWRSNER